MAGEDWPLVPLGELTENFDGRRVPVKELERKPGPYPYYGASGIVDRVDGYLFDGEYLLIGEDGENLRTRQTPIAFMAKGKFWVNNHAHIVRGNHRADTRFLSYVLSQTDISGYLTGSTMPKLTQGNLNRLPVVAPPLAEQKAIAAVLGALDDKIELNRRMNATLEAMARALFQSWFVDFDPVRAKLEGRHPPALEPATASLFPDRIDRSEDFPRPEGWTISSLGDHVDLVRGNTYKSKLKDLPGPYLLGLGSIHRNGGFRDDSLRTYGGESSPKLILRPGDLFASLKDVTQAADLLGAVARVPLGIPAGRLTQDTVKLVPRDTGISLAYLYRTLLRPECREYCRGRATGTTNLGLSREDFLNYPVLVPPKALQAAFDRHDFAIESRIANNCAQSRTLAALRDTLLPRLLSGELSVAKAAAEAAA